MSKNKGTGFEAFALMSHLGFTLAIPIILAVLIGHWIDIKLHTDMIFLIIFMIIGIAAGSIGAYRLVMGTIKRK